MSSTPKTSTLKNRERGILYVNFDGLCEPKNPGGVATYGLIIRADGDILLEDSGLAYAEPWTDDASNNVAEYSAIIRGLEWLDGKREYHDAPIVIRGDSKLVINQLKGLFKVKSMRLVELHHRARELLSHFGDVRMEWIDRSQNAEADLQSRIAYRKYMKSHQGKVARPSF
ncbi:MAG: ribonuclease HI [Nitrososphaerales archaeon]